MLAEEVEQQAVDLLGGFHLHHVRLSVNDLHLGWQAPRHAAPG